MVRLPLVSRPVLLVPHCNSYTGTQRLIQAAETASGKLGFCSNLRSDLYNKFFMLYFSQILILFLLPFLV